MTASELGSRIAGNLRDSPMMGAGDGTVSGCMWSGNSIEVQKLVIFESLIPSVPDAFPGMWAGSLSHDSIAVRTLVARGNISRSI